VTPLVISAATQQGVPQALRALRIAIDAAEEGEEVPRELGERTSRPLALSHPFPARGGG